MKTPSSILILSTLATSLAFPSSMMLDIRSDTIAGKERHKIEIPPRPTYTGLKQIPDKHHPWRAPGPTDNRGPCPGLNTMANHGYLPRNGIATYAQLVSASTEALAFEYDFAANTAALAILTRGNSNEGTVSIGNFSSLVTNNPQNIDNRPMGLSEHGRFEGDASILHLDHKINGDAIGFSMGLFNTLKEYVKKYSKDGKDVDIKVLQEFKYKTFKDMQSQNKQFELSPLRHMLSYNEVGFVHALFRNGKTGKLSLEDVESFFGPNRFPKDFYRRGEPADALTVQKLNEEVIKPHPTHPGKNDKNGKYQPEPYNFNDPCQVYRAFLSDIPSILNNATGNFGKNVDFFANIIHSRFAAQCYKEKFIGTYA